MCIPTDRPSWMRASVVACVRIERVEATGEEGTRVAGTLWGQPQTSERLTDKVVVGKLEGGGGSEAGHRAAGIETWDPWEPPRTQ